MSDMEMEKLWEKLYEEHLEQVLKKIKDWGLYAPFLFDIDLIKCDNTINGRRILCLKKIKNLKKDGEERQLIF